MHTSSCSAAGDLLLVDAAAVSLRLVFCGPTCYTFLNCLSFESLLCLLVSSNEMRTKRECRENIRLDIIGLVRMSTVCYIYGACGAHRV